MRMTCVQFLRTSPPECALQMWARGQGVEHGGPSFDATVRVLLFHGTAREVYEGITPYLHLMEVS